MYRSNDNQPAYVCVLGPCFFSCIVVLCMLGLFCLAAVTTNMPEQAYLFGTRDGWHAACTNMHVAVLDVVQLVQITHYC